MKVHADLGILLNCTTYLFHSNSAFHLPAGSNEERNGQESSVDKEVAALQQALAMMQMENIPVNGSAEETGTKKKAGIATIARYPYFTLGVEVAVLLKLLYSLETQENSILFQNQRNCVGEFTLWTSTPAKYLSG